jgi:hypothetical protein
MDDTLNYLNKLEAKIEKKDLEDFWMLVDREDFKPIKGLSDKELYKKIKNKLGYYAGKRIALVKINVKNESSYVKNKESLIHVVFDIRKISSSGLLDHTGSSLKVLYYEDDLEKNKLTLKDVHRFMKLCADDILGSSVIGGIKYSKLMVKLKEKKIKF